MQRDPNIHRELHDLVQGTPAWNAYRANHDNASDAPAMMSCSPYKTRSELIHQYATGISPEIDARTQKLFDDGHRFEALARDRVAELDLVGMELYPNIASLGRLSASYDGLTMCETIVWEHKSINTAIRASETAADLPLMYRVQMEQQMHIVGADRALFSATSWDDHDSLLEEKHFWYESDLALRQQIIDGWEQFALDVDAYVPVEIVEPAKAAAIADLPVVTVQVRGELTMCNLKDITPQFDKFLAEAKLVLKTDDDFALAEEQAKTGRAAAKQCKLTAKAVVDQMASVAEVTRSLEEYASKFDAMALQQEKAVKEQKDARRAAAKLERDKSYSDHMAALNAELHPLRLNVADADKPQFAEVMKNQRTLASLYNKLDAELARVKIAANQAATDIRAKVTWYNANVGDYRSLFADLQQIIGKAMDDFQLVVTTRIDKHKADEKAKEDALRAQIAAQERAKAEAAAADKLAAERKADADRAATEQARVAAEAKAAAERQAADDQAERDRLAAEQRAQQTTAAQLERPTTAAAALAQANALADQARLADLADQQVQVEELQPAADLFSQQEVATDTPPTLRLGQINERIAPLAISADGLLSLGFAPAATEKAAKLYHECDFPRICAAIQRHLSTIQAKFAA
jgi:predicted phage-related endonuclease